MRADHPVDRVREAEAKLFAQVFPQRRTLAREIVDASLIPLERLVATAPVDAAGRRPAIGRPAGVVGIGVVGVERRRAFGRQGVGPDGVGCIGHDGGGGGGLVERGPLGVGHIRAFIAFEQGIAFEFLLDEGRDLDVRKLEKLDCLPQLRRHHQCLALTEVKTGGNRHRPDYRARLAEVNQKRTVADAKSVLVYPCGREK